MKFFPVICDTLLITATRSASEKFRVTSSAWAWRLVNSRPRDSNVYFIIFIVSTRLPR